MLKKTIPALLLVFVLSAWTQHSSPAAMVAEKPAGPISFELFKDAKKEYRWKLKAANGKVMAVSNDGYSTKASCQSAINLIKEGAATASVEDTTKD
jgi:uncharacterized protein YegP (UPF0339 family)